MNAPTYDADVSVVLAVKDEALYIESALLSILTQSGLRQDVVVVDDHSTDDTFAILSRMADSHRQLRIFRNPKAGKVAAFNYGVSLARGPFVCIFAGDDIMPAGSLAERWTAIKDRSSSSPVVGLCKLVTLSDDKRQDGHLVPRKPGRGALSGVSYLMNRPALARLFPIPEEFPNEDTWLELAVTHLPGLEIVHCDAVGCAWRIHAGNSINLLVGFDDFNARLTPRMRAIPQFYERHRAELTEESRKQLLAAIECEENRARGNVIGVLLSPVGLVPKLRALSASNKLLYGIRSRLYGLFSGW